MRDNDTDPSSGILQDPPDLHTIDWQEVIKEMHNRLVDNGLITWRDVQVSQRGVTNVITSVLRKRVINLYKLQEVE